MHPGTFGEMLLGNCRQIERLLSQDAQRFPIQGPSFPRPLWGGFGNEGAFLVVTVTRGCYWHLGGRWPRTLNVLQCECCPIQQRFLQAPIPVVLPWAKLETAKKVPDVLPKEPIGSLETKDQF